MRILTVSKMKDTAAILKNLRQLMCQQPKPINAYIVPTDDAHQSEYICQRDERRAFLTGFTGSAGTAVVTNDSALLWTDGRYYQQASKELDGNWTLMKDGQVGTPTIGNWLSKNLSKNSLVGVDPKLMSFHAWEPIRDELDSNDCELIGIEKNLIDQIWDNQPEGPNDSTITLDLKYAGKKICEKWSEVRNQMVEKRADALVVSALDEIAWFLNMRGSDIEYNPVFFSYLIITMDEILLFIDSKKLPSNFETHEKNNEVSITVLKYDDIKNKLIELCEKTEKKIWIARGSSYFLKSLIPKKKLHLEITPLANMKAIKNETEAQGFIDCHIRDGAALCQYFAWLNNEIATGCYVDEISGAEKLEGFRKIKENYMGLSFTTISSSGANGSIIHYHPTKETNKQITDKDIYLCDSGAQYLDGTTDVTRTLHFGTPTDFEMEAYTRVLKGQLNLAGTIFPNKVKGHVLDVLARKALWDIGLDYAHGTGHGVGHFLNVHEGPMGIGFRLMPNDPGLQANMFISNEPGFYKDGQFGIRIEDIVQIVPTESVHNFAGRGALTFKTITMCPKQTKMIKTELLTELEIRNINEYNKMVRDVVTPILKAENDTFTIEWLNRETAPIQNCKQ